MLERNVGLTSQNEKDKGVQLGWDNNSVVEANPNFSSSIAQHQNQVHPLVAIGEGGDGIKANKSSYDNVVLLIDSVNTSSKEPGSSHEIFDGSYLSAQDLHLEKEIGAGSFGKVFKGTYHGLSVAAKQLKTQEISNDNKKALFEYEASRLAILNHPNVVGFYGFCPKDNEYYMVMEFCDGGSLWSALQKKRITTLAQKWRIALDMAQGLAYIHDQGTLHRDLKADNVLLDKEGRAKLADLGLAEADQLLTGQVQVDVASELHRKYIPFASPEECRGEESTKATDIYSFGVLLWQLFMVEEPYANIDLMAIEEMVLAHKTPPIPTDISILSKSIAVLIQKCWAMKPEERPTAQQVFIELEGLANEFHPQGVAIRILQNMDELIYPSQRKLATYLAPYASPNDLEQNQNWDSYWRTFEENKPNAEQKNKEAENKEAEDKESKRPKFLTNEVDKFLNSSAKVMLVFGDAGVGKTITTYQVANEMAHKARNAISQQQNLSWLPIFIRPGISNWTQANLINGITTALKSAAYYLDDLAIKDLKNYPVLFILDGYDELIIAANEERKNLATELNLADWPNAKLLITSRRQVVDEREESRIFQFQNQYDKCYLLPFCMNQILKYLSSSLNLDQKEYETKLQSATELRSILRNPFVLSLFVQSFTELQHEDFNQLTRYKIYDSYVQHWLSQNQKQLSLEVQTILETETKANLITSYNRFASELAYDFFLQGILHGECRTLNSWHNLEKLVVTEAKKAYDKARKEAPNERAIFNEADFTKVMQTKCQRFLSSAPLKKRGLDYSFMHKSFYEYFALKNIVNVFRDNEEKQNISTLTPRSLQDEPEIFAFWSEFWQGADLSLKDKLKEKLFQVVYASRQHAENSQAAANAITLLNSARVPFSGLDLSNISIPGANLQYALLDHTNLTSTNLQNVHLEDTFLHETKLCNSNMEGVSLGAEGGFEIDLANVDKVEESPDGSLLVLGGKDAKAVYIWSVKEQNQMVEIPCRGLNEIQFSPQGDLLVLGGENAKAAYIWSVKEQKQIAEILCKGEGESPYIKYSGLHSFQFSPQGDLLVLGGEYAEAAYIWSVKEQKQLAEIPVGAFGEFQFSPQGDFLVWGGKFTACTYIWSVKRQERIAEIPCPGKFQFSPQGDLLVLGGGYDGRYERYAYVWSVKEQKQIAEISCEKLDKFQFSPQGDLLVLGGENAKAAYIWSVKEQKQIAEIHCEKYADSIGIDFYRRTLYEFQFSPQGDLLVLGGENVKAIYIWSVKEQKLIAEIPVEGYGKFQFSPQGDLLVFGGRKTEAAHIWSVKDQKQIAEIPGKGLDEFQFSSQGDLLVLGGRYNAKSAYIWSVKEQKQIAEIPYVNKFQFSPQSDFLVLSGSHAEAYIWSIKKLKQIGKLEDVLYDCWLSNNIFVVHKHNNCYICDATNIGQDKMSLIKEMSSPIKTVVLLKGSKLLISSEKNCYLCADYSLRMENKRLVEFSGVHGSVSKVSFFAQDFLLCVGGSAVVFSMKEQRQMAEIPVGAYGQFQFSPQGDLLVLGGYWAEAAYIWSVKEQKQVVKIQGRYLDKFQFSSKGDILVLGGKYVEAAYIWSVKEQKQIAEIPCKGLDEFRFSLQGDLLVLSRSDVDAKGVFAYIWSVKEQKQLVKIPYAYKFQFSPQGDLLVFGEPKANKAYIWSVKEQKQIAEIPVGAYGEYQFSPQGDLLVLGGQKSAYIWSIKEQRQLTEIPVGERGKFQFSPQGDLLVLSESNAKVAYIWSVKEQKQIAEVSGVDSFEFSPQGDLLVLGGHNAKAVYIWSVKEQKQIAEIPVGAWGRFQFSPQGNFLVLSGIYIEVTYIWSVKEQKQIAKIPCKFVETFQFSPQGDLLVLRGGYNAKSAYICSIKEQRQLTEIPVGEWREFQFSPQGDLLVLGGSLAQAAYIWSVKELKQVAEIPVGEDGKFQFSPNQKLIALYGKISCYLYDIPQNKLYCLLHNQAVNTVAFSEDGHWLATGGADRTLRLWDISDPARPLLQYCSSGLTLYAKDADIENVHGLNTANRALLKQHGAIGEATKIVGKTEEKNSASLSTTSSMQITAVKEGKDNSQQLVQQLSSSISSVSTTTQALQQQGFFAQQSSSSTESSISSESLGKSNQNRSC